MGQVIRQPALQIPTRCTFLSSFIRTIYPVRVSNRFTTHHREAVTVYAAMLFIIHLRRLAANTISDPLTVLIYSKHVEGRLF
jgi:hypothetical protein